MPEHIGGSELFFLLLVHWLFIVISSLLRKTGLTWNFIKLLYRLNTRLEQHLRSHAVLSGVKRHSGRYLKPYHVFSSELLQAISCICIHMYSIWYLIITFKLLQLCYWVPEIVSTLWQKKDMQVSEHNSFPDSEMSCVKPFCLLSNYPLHTHLYQVIS